jgi:hypothetical protein
MKKQMVLIIVALGLIAASLARGQSPRVHASAATKTTSVGIEGGELAREEQRLETVCYDYESYFVVSMDLKDEVGSNIIVRHKKTNDEQNVCEYAVKVDDFEVKNGVKNGDAFYFFGIADNVLFIDDGTGPNRTLHLYNIPLREKILDISLYQSPVRAEDAHHVSYWQTYGEATRDQCPTNYDQLHEEQMGPMVEVKCLLDLRSLEIKTSKETRCGSVQ